MRLRVLAAAFITLAIGLPSAFAQGHPTAQCGFNQDKSKLLLTVANSGDGAFACMAQCKYSLAGAPALHTFSCNYSLSGSTAEKVACDLDGNGPGHFAEVRPTSFVCQPR